MILYILVELIPEVELELSHGSIKGSSLSAIDLPWQGHINPLYTIMPIIFLTPVQ